MISPEDKQDALLLIDEACKAGARRSVAADLLGLSLRTVQRWKAQGLKDQRKGTRSIPPNQFSPAERERILKVVNSPEFRDTNPHQIVPRLADVGIYLGSESTIYRILRQEKMNRHRNSSKVPCRKRPDALTATAPNQIWSWDITYLPTSVQGRYYYLYMMMDIFSRKIVGFQVYEYESGEMAADLLTDACRRQRIHKGQLTLHSDNGSPMKAYTMLAKMESLGVITSFSRPRTSNDNAYSESLFRTLKYRPEYPDQPFNNLHEARDWSNHFVNWYNGKHLHSAIGFVTPDDRHALRDALILENRRQVYQDAKARNPKRWSRDTRKWEYIDKVDFNKKRKTSAVIEKIKKAA